MLNCTQTNTVRSSSILPSQFTIVQRNLLVWAKLSPFKGITDGLITYTMERRYHVLFYEVFQENVQWGAAVHICWRVTCTPSYLGACILNEAMYNNSNSAKLCLHSGVVTGYMCLSDLVSVSEVHVHSICPLRKVNCVCAKWHNIVQCSPTHEWHTGTNANAVAGTLWLLCFLSYYTNKGLSHMLQQSHWWRYVILSCCSQEITDKYIFITFFIQFKTKSDGGVPQVMTTGL